ncbi:hypothetical protein CVT24_007484 [Panaeolus cyanescens]|uniref:Uncharacterized protein n=1 Tax=Panaeolus cyanescens TaxID=181874 RepID=A0A409YWI6_9AGAR|nr:hypothetical protein CVT24_007484 [Panaeolus cyanescens]
MPLRAFRTRKIVARIRFLGHSTTHIVRTATRRSFDVNAGSLSLPVAIEDVPASSTQGTASAEQEAGLVGDVYSWKAGDIVWGAAAKCLAWNEAGTLGYVQEENATTKIKHPMIVTDFDDEYLQILICSHSLPPTLLKNSAIANIYTQKSNGYFTDKTDAYNLIPTRVALGTPLLISQQNVTPNDAKRVPSLPTALSTDDLYRLLEDSGIGTTSLLIRLVWLLRECNVEGFNE